MRSARTITGEPRRLVRPMVSGAVSRALANPRERNRRWITIGKKNCGRVAPIAKPRPANAASTSSMVKSRRRIEPSPVRNFQSASLKTSVRTVAGGGALIEPSVARKVVAEFARVAPPARRAEAGLAEPLNAREREILRLVAQGLSNREIAERLSLAQGTVKNYVTTILQKLGARDRTQAALRARELGLI